ncbi:hypothetical protein [Sphaerothrix gracilis]
MADKAQIKRHISMTTGIDFKITPPAKGDEARKNRIMEHVKKSKG